MDKFFLLGIFDRDSVNYLSPGEVDDVIDLLDVKDAIVRPAFVHRGDITREKADGFVRESSSFYSGSREGIVIHEYSDAYRQGLRMEKYFNPQFKEVDETKHGLGRYVTFRRLVKAAQNLGAYGKRLTFEDVVSASVDDVLRDFRDVRRGKLHQRFIEPEVKRMFFERVLPLFNRPNNSH